MDPARWSHVEQLYHAALEQRTEQRASFLERACAGDASLREEVESLLEFAGEADAFLQSAIQDAVSQASAGGAVAAVQTAPESIAGQKLGRYELLEVLGKGGMGVVYRAMDPAISRIVAIKTMLVEDEEGTGPALRNRFLRESQAAGRLSHPNIVAVHDVCEEGKATYIVMEYVEGCTLDQMMREDPSFRFGNQPLRIIKDCAAALDYAHGRGVVHRDIKPSNIMLQPDGTVKIADFGIARISQTSPLTQTAVPIGSPHFMAPEQWRNESVTGQTDQYALASVAYVMLTGRRPFESDVVATLAAMTLYQEPPGAASFNSQLNPPVDDVFRRALSKTPAARYSSCTEFAAALEHASCNVPAPKPQSKRKALLLGAALIFVIAVSAAAWFYYGRRPPSVTVAKPPAPQQTQQQIPKPVDSAVVSKRPPARRRVVAPADVHPDQNRAAEGDSLLKQGAYAEAVQAFTKAIASKPDYKSYFGRAGAYQRLDRMQEAINDYTQSIRLKPDSAMAYHDRAVCESRLLQNDLAFADYNRALELGPDNPRTWNGRGAIYLRRKDYTKAIPDFDQAIRLQPDFAQAYLNRAAAKRATGDRTGADADFAQAKALTQQSPKP